MDRRVAFLVRGYDGTCRIAVQPKPAWGAEVPPGQRWPMRGKEMIS